MSFWKLQGTQRTDLTPGADETRRQIEPQVVCHARLLALPGAGVRWHLHRHGRHVRIYHMRAAASDPSGFPSEAPPNNGLSRHANAKRWEGCRADSMGTYSTLRATFVVCRPEQHLLGGGQLLQLARVRALSALRLPRRHLLLLARAVVRLVDTKKCNWSGQGYCWHVHHIYVKPAPRCAARNGFTSPLQALAGSLHACSLSCHHLLLCDDEAGAEQLQQTPRQ